MSDAVAAHLGEPPFFVVTHLLCGDPISGFVEFKKGRSG
jgi:hypothetical protein